MNFAERRKQVFEKMERQTAFIVISQRLTKSL